MTTAKHIQSRDVQWLQTHETSFFPHEESSSIHSAAIYPSEKLSPSDQELLFGSHLKAPTWAHFSAPELSDESLKKCFDKRLIPGFDLADALMRYEKETEHPRLSSFFSLFEELSILMETIMINTTRYKKG